MKIYYKGPLSDHFDGYKFFNPWEKRSNSFKALLKWRLHANPKPWPKKINALLDIPPEKINNDCLRVSFVGHATVLMQTQSMNILTDPVWSNRASPFRFFGPKRVTEPGIAFDQLPKIDVILISHNHYDHLDIATIKKLWDRDKPHIVVPLGNDAIIQAAYPEIAVTTLDWHQNKQLNEVTIHLEPAQHWSARNLFDQDKALWGAFVIETPKGNIYFAGDTGYGEGKHFRETLQKFGSFRFAMLPIGAYEPRWFMKYAHMNPTEAVRAYFDLGEPCSMAIHFATFHLADEGYFDPSLALALEKKNYHIKEKQFRALQVGEVWEIF